MRLDKKVTEAEMQVSDAFVKTNDELVNQLAVVGIIGFIIATISAIFIIRFSRFQKKELEDLIQYNTASHAFAVAFALRLLIIPLSEYHINPYANNDAVGFEKAAKAIAGGAVANWDPLYAYDTWGAILAPFWWIPGPSSVYAHIFVALLGSVGIYMVYRIAEHLHSQTAAICAVIPMIFFPSFMLIQTSLTREAFIFCMLTTTTMLLIVPSQSLSPQARWLLAGVCIALATFVRYENLPFYILAIGLGFGIHEYQHRDVSSQTIKLVRRAVALVAVLGLPLWIQLFRWSLRNIIVPQRLGRAFGNSVYLIVVPNTILKAIWFTPIGISYFYFTPLPWMIQAPRFIPVMLEGFINIGFAIFTVIGLRQFIQTKSVKTIPLFTAFVLFSVLYGLIEANVGAAVRHRQMFVWVLYLIGAIGFTEYVLPRSWKHAVDTNNTSLSS